MPRLTTWNSRRLTEKQQALYDSIVNVPRGKFGCPFLALIHAPEFADKIQEVCSAQRFRERLSPLLRQAAILSVGYLTTLSILLHSFQIEAEPKEGIPPADLTL